jgi:uncharacterized protein YuzE
MRKENFLMVVFMAFISFAVAQTTFEETYNYGTSDQGTSVIELTDGYMLTGATTDDQNGDFDVFVTKVDFDGNEIWTNFYSDIGVGDDYATYLTSTSDGYYLITGRTEDYENGDEDVFVLKISSNGNVVWIENYDGNEAEDDGANYIVETYDGDYLICGYSMDENNVDMWLFEITSSGSFVGENFYGLNGYDEANCVVELDDGSVIIVGSSYDEANGDTDGVLIKTDVDGNEEWVYYTTGTADEEFNDVIVDEYGDFLIVGSQEDEANGDLDILLENITDDGSTTLYSYTFDYNGGDDEAFRVYINPANECFIVGAVEDFNTDDTDAYIASVDINTGSITGEVLYGDIFDDVFFDFDFTADNGFICIGYSEQNNQGNSDVYLVKTDENGQVTGVPVLSKNPELNIYPNPVDDYLQVKSDFSSDTKYIIKNTNGQKIQSGEIGSSIDVTNLTKGVYLIEVVNNNKTFTNKFIKL